MTLDDLDKAEPAPTKVGEMSPDRRKIGIQIPGRIVWDLHPDVKKPLDEKTLNSAKEWIKTQPVAHHPILKQFINNTLSDPYRHLRFGANSGTGPSEVRQRHINQMVTNDPNAQLTVHSPESLSLHIGRHGDAGGISHFQYNLKNNIAKSENLVYNNGYGTYTDEFGNRHIFGNGNGESIGVFSKRENSLGSSDGLFRLSGGSEEIDIDRVRSISELLRFSSMRGISGQISDERSDESFQRSGSSLLTDQLVKHFQSELSKNETLAKMPISFKGTKQKPFTVIHRMQNEHGEGPYGTADVPSLDTHGTGLSENYTPAPEHDRGFNPDDKQDLKNIPNVKFAFEKPEHAKNWFSPEETEQLAQQGFTLQPVKAAKVWSSGKQAFYEAYKGKTKKKI